MATNFTEAVARFALYVATALPVNSVSVTTPAKKNYVPPLEFGGGKILFFHDLGRLSPPLANYVEPPLMDAPVQRCSLIRSNGKF